MNLSLSRFGLLHRVGFPHSLINGMLYKIVPFPVWFHLQGLSVRAVSSMKEVLPDVPLGWQAAGSAWVGHEVPDIFRFWCTNT